MPTLLLLLLLALHALAALPDDPAAALASVDARAAPLEQIRYKAVRNTVNGDRNVEERWLFASGTGGRFRVDYFGDTTRQLVCDGHVLWDYVPARRAALRVDLDALPADERATVLGQVLSKVSVPGLRTGYEAAGLTEFAWAAEGEQGGAPTRTVVGRDARGGQLSFTLDVEHGWLLSSLIEESGIFVASVDSSDFREVRPELWIPHRVVSTAPGPGGKVRSEILLRQVEVGVDLPDRLFSLVLDPSIQVQNRP